MYLLYVDESGDVGKVGSPNQFFVLSAIVVHDSTWLDLLDDLIAFRRSLKQRYGLNMKEEIHASVFVNGQCDFNRRVKRNDRIDLLKKCLDWLAQRNDVSIYSVRCNKAQVAANRDVFETCWTYLIQRFENTMSYGNFPGGYRDNKGLILSDNTDGGKLTGLLRKMRRYNPVPNMPQHGPGYRNMRLRAVVEDPVMRDSADSYLHQMVDVVAYFARQAYEPNRYIRKKGAKNYYGRLGRTINPHVTRQNTLHNIVEI